MKKKYLAILLVGIMCSFSFLSGCGKTAEPEEDTSIEEDEDDDDKDRDDDEDEDEKPSASAVVKSIDDKTLESQVDVFLKNRKTWVIPHDEAVLYEGTSYALSDLNYNGRAELTVAYHEGTTANVSTVNIYEINEKGDGIDLLEWEFDGIDKELKSYPDMGFLSAINGYYDKENGIFHYLFSDWYAYSFAHGGCREHDISFVDGKVIDVVYAKTESKGSDRDEVTTFTGSNGDMSEDAYYAYLGSYYDDNNAKEFWFGLYYADSVYSQNKNIVEEMSDDEIKDILTDSYRLFAERITYGEFFDKYIAENNPEQTSEWLFNEMIGSWGLYMTDAEGYVEYYEPDDQYYMTLDVFEDRTVHLEEYLNTDYEYTIEGNLLDKADGMLIVQYMPPASDGMAYDFMLLTFTTIDEDGHLVVMCDSWNGNEYFPGSTWYFEKLD